MRCVPLSVIGSARRTICLPVGVMQLAEEPQSLKKKKGEKQHIIYTARENRKQGKPSVVLGTLKLAVDLG